MIDWNFAGRSFATSLIGLVGAIIIGLALDDAKYFVAALGLYVVIATGVSLGTDRAHQG